MSTRTIKVIKDILESNDLIAAENRSKFENAGALAINIIGSPGSGKTSLILQTIKALQHKKKIGVIEGDVAGDIDTKRVLAGGAEDAVQINTGGNCHLEARMVRQAMQNINLNALDIIFIENVGNLICPNHWSLGEAIKLCLISVAEGDDKPIKYPEIFAASDVIVLTKNDLIAHVDFNKEFFYESLRALNPTAPLLEISSRTGDGIQGWSGWLVDQCAQKRKS
ncbi:hydrogenase nickel incorporation protein HypB [Candidatus Acetothermia bacterium]|nr:hydrogenase nickel incorporation protein HypB [Candidatus Acetothermia bacterium]MBI3644302.1 hydrogenase nickel incorporation protein HypB [Candidatus Acetothermia bacterium]